MDTLIDNLYSLGGLSSSKANAPASPPDPVDTILWLFVLLICLWLFLVLVKWVLRWLDAAITVVSYGLYIATIVAFFCTGLYIVLYCQGNSSECLLIMNGVVMKVRPLFDKTISLLQEIIHLISVQFF